MSLETGERLPTRVLDVGDRNSPGSLSLHCTQQDERGEYIDSLSIIQDNKNALKIHS